MLVPDTLDPPLCRSARMRMVSEQIVARGVIDHRVVAAMKAVPRHLFVPEELKRSAYADCPLPIGHGATISQPYIVGLMTSLISITPGDRVLELGTGSGYQAALLGVLAGEVISFERIPELATTARENLSRINITNVTIIEGDGTAHLKDYGAFDAILVTAASPTLPNYLRKSLRPDGRCVVPVGSPDSQVLMRMKNRGGQILITHHGGVRFVPLIGENAWNSENT